MNTILRTICLAFCLILSVSVITSCKKGTHPPATKPEAQGIGTGGQASTEMEGCPRTTCSTMPARTISA